MRNHLDPLNLVMDPAHVWKNHTLTHFGPFFAPLRAHLKVPWIFWLIWGWSICVLFRTNEKLYGSIKFGSGSSSCLKNPRVGPFWTLFGPLRAHMSVQAHFFLHFWARSICVQWRSNENPPRSIKFGSGSSSCVKNPDFSPFWTLFGPLRAL